MAKAARYEFKESPCLPVVFRSKTYGSASDALSAYISDYEGRQVTNNMARYEKEMLNLFCPQYQPVAKTTGKPSLGAFRQGKSKRETELEKLVQQAYDQLRRLKENKKVEESLSASTRLLEKLDHDRLPSPTRSAILQPTGRPSTESVATDVLLNAKPVDFHAPYSQQTQSHSNKSLLESLDLKGDSGLSNSFTTRNGPYQLKGMNELMQSMKSEKSLSTDNLSVEELLSSSRNRSHGADISRNSQLSHPLRREDLLSASQLGSIKSRLNSEYPLTAGFSSNPLANSWDSALSMKHVAKASNAWEDSLCGAGNLRNDVKQSQGSKHGHVSEQDIDALLNDSGTRTSHMHSLNKSKDRDLKPSRNTSKANSFDHGVNTSRQNSFHYPHAPKPTVKPVSSVPAYLSSGYSSTGQGQGHMNGSITSGATDKSSSIISGHLLKSKRQNGVSKVVSTPKRGDKTQTRSASEKQLRFEIDGSSYGQSLDAKDISAHSRSLDLSNIDKVSVEKPDFTFGRKGIVSILKPQSPGKIKRASSRVSFTTDDLIHADASGLADLERKPRSRSLPRPHDRGEQSLNGSYADQNQYLRNGHSESKPNAYHNHSTDFTSRSLHQHESLVNGYSKSQDSPLRSSSRARLKEYGYGSKLPTPGSLNRSAEEARQSRYKQFLEGLMREIEDSSSTIVTSHLLSEQSQTRAGGDVTPQQSFHLAPQTGTNENGPGFLARIKELLSTPPSVSQYMNGSSNGHTSAADGHDDSLSTDAVLEGDRSWERIVPFKSPKEVTEKEKKDRNRFEKFMDDCIAEASGDDKTLTGKAQPGALETLKNMMFKMQSFSEPQTHDDTLDGTAPDISLDDSIDKLLSPETKRLLSKSYSTQPGGPCLAKAMEHLNKLKDLVDNKADVEN